MGRTLFKVRPTALAAPSLAPPAPLQAEFSPDWPPSLAPLVQFLAKLFAEPGKKVTDPTTGAKHTIDPQQLAHRILQVGGPHATRDRGM